MIRLSRLLGGWLAGGLVLFSILAAAPALAAPAIPDRGTRPVVDDAHILSAATVQSLSDKLTALEKSTGRQMVVVTLPSLQDYPIEEVGIALLRGWKLGDKERDDGIVFVIAPNDRKVRIEVGYGLEPVITDAMSSVIINQAVIPRFKAGDMEGGVVAGTDALIQQLSLPDDQAKAKASAAASTVRERHSRGDFPPVAGIVIAIFIFFLISSIFRGGRRGGGLGGALPWIILGSLANSRDDDRWGGGGGWGGGGFGGGGGGFSGGGGSGGGGGASGSW